MGSNKLENFVMENVSRSQINEAPYNPRKIGEEGRKKLKKGLKTFGLVQPVIVNRQTMNCVGGHQRLAIMDKELNYPAIDYQLQVSMIDVDDETEVKINVFLNNPAAQGEWDEEKLQEIKLSFPEIDFQKDLGFDMLDIQHIFAGSDDFEDIQSIFDPKPEQIDIVDMATAAGKADKVKKARQDERDMRKEENRGEDDYQAKHDNYTITLVFESNSAKADFCQRARLSNERKDAYIKSSVLYDIYDHKVQLRELS